MAKPCVLIDFEITVAGWKRIPRLRAKMKQAADAAFKHLPKKFQMPIEVTMLLTSNVRMQNLNHDFRGLNKPTNVLSFPQFSPAQLAKMGKNADRIMLGDIALAYQYVVAEAKKDHKLLINHITHLMIHGLLHLLGYDHLLDLEAEKMEKLETTIMKSLGLPDPYAPAPTARTKNRQ